MPEVVEPLWEDVCQGTAEQDPIPQLPVVWKCLHEVLEPLLENVGRVTSQQNPIPRLPVIEIPEVVELL
jgi:hypothetical protein